MMEHDIGKWGMCLYCGMNVSGGQCEVATRLHIKDKPRAVPSRGAVFDSEAIGDYLRSKGYEWPFRKEPEAAP